MRGKKIFQIAVAKERIYGIGEDGTLEVAYLEGDNLGKEAPKDKKLKDESYEEEEDNTQGDQIKVNYQYKVVKIEDIPIDQVNEQTDANNASILAGSEAEDDDGEYEEASMREQSISKITSKATEKNRRIY